MANESMPELEPFRHERRQDTRSNPEESPVLATHPLSFAMVRLEASTQSVPLHRGLH